MSEVYSVFLSAIFSSFIITSIICMVIFLYNVLYKSIAAYISFDKIVQTLIQQKKIEDSVIH